MTDEDLIIFIDKPHFTVKLHETLLQVDLKEGVRKKLEAFVESNPKLRESLGLLFQSVIPLDVQLKHIESVKSDEKGQVKIMIPHRSDIIIPLEKNEADKLIGKLNELIPLEKERELERVRAAAARRAEGELRKAEATFEEEESERFR
jgi:hypothetical protein